MKAFHGDPDLKARVLAGLDAHRQADELVQGTYWSGEKGCAVGCVNHDLDPTVDPGDHEAWERLIGVPAQIAWLIDSIFEALPTAEAKAWPTRVVGAIPVSADLSGVWGRYASWMLHDLAALGRDPDGVVSGMAALFDRATSGDEPTEDEWDAAAGAARDAGAAWAARAAGAAGVAWAAWVAWVAWAAGAAQAARAARAARDARDAWAARAAQAARAAWAARDARAARAAGAAQAARAARVRESADRLCELLAAAPTAAPA